MGYLMEGTLVLESGRVAVQRQLGGVAATSMMSWRRVSRRIGEVMYALESRNNAMDFQWIADC
jgi:hypothetical protein